MVGEIADFWSYLYEPLNNRFKDEVREVGRALRLSRKLSGEHPFPGPAGIRIWAMSPLRKLKHFRSGLQFIQG